MPRVSDSSHCRRSSKLRPPSHERLPMLCYVSSQICLYMSNNSCERKHTFMFMVHFPQKGCFSMGPSSTPPLPPTKSKDYRCAASAPPVTPDVPPLSSLCRQSALHKWDTESKRFENTNSKYILGGRRSCRFTYLLMHTSMYIYMQNCTSAHMCTQNIFM